MNPWLQFAFVILAQLVVFLVFVYIKKIAWKRTLKVFGCSLLISIPFGIGFDLLVGYTIGVYSYELGFTALFLFFNGALSYGLAMASVAILDFKPFSYFYAFVLVKAVVYEVTNFVWPVWYWEFPGSFWLQEAAVIIIGYAGLAILMKLVYKRLVNQVV